MEMKVYDNYLDPSVFAELQSIFVDNWNFPWFYHYGVASLDQKDDLNVFQFVHTLFRENEGVSSEYFKYVKPLIDQINPKVLLRIKLNLGTITPTHIEGGWHNDFDFPCKTAVFYLNDNNGYTLFKDGTKVESKENRFAIFDSALEHTGVSQTNTKTRVLMNINYID
jgi:hypothetical protein